MNNTNPIKAPTNKATQKPRSKFKKFFVKLSHKLSGKSRSDSARARDDRDHFTTALEERSLNRIRRAENNLKKHASCQKKPEATSSLKQYTVPAPSSGRNLYIVLAVLFLLQLAAGFVSKATTA